jgi:hypothetical protein
MENRDRDTTFELNSIKKFPKLTSNRLFTMHGRNNQQSFKIIMPFTQWHRQPFRLRGAKAHNVAQVDPAASKIFAFLMIPYPLQKTSILCESRDPSGN